MNVGPALIGLVGAGLLALMIMRLGAGPGGRRPVALVAALAFGVRVVAVAIVHQVAIQVHGEGTWLADEASFFLATEKLMPHPLDQELPVGLDHLGGNGYLGLTTSISLLLGNVDSTAFRTANAVLGAIVAVLCLLIARRLFGVRAGLAAGLVVAVWPTLVLWSATFLRDTLGSVAVVSVWWGLSRARENGRLRTLCVVALGLILTFSLRAYLGAAIGLGVLAWVVYPSARRLSRRAVLLGAAAAAAAATVIGVWQARQLDFVAHELFYRQTVTRMETLGLLYSETPITSTDRRFLPGSAVAIVHQSTGWVQAGVVRQPLGDEQVEVAFVDNTIRVVPTGQLVPLQSAPVPPVQLFDWVWPDLISYVTGLSMGNDPSSPAWIVGALAWDVLLVVAVVAVVGSRPRLREVIYPACVVGGTVLALIAVPGVPGNADRHRATQTVPLLVVLAAGALSVSARASAPELPVTTATTSPARAAAAANSRMRSAR